MKSILALAATLFLLTGASLASESDETVTFDVEKMTCATCPIAVRKAMQRVEGVKEVEVSMEDESAVVTYAHRLWDFFRGLFLVSFSTIFDLFKINEDFHYYLDALTDALKGVAPFQGCET